MSSWVVPKNSHIPPTESGFLGGGGGGGVGKNVSRLTEYQHKI